jgi:hypothetical protein
MTSVDADLRSGRQLETGCRSESIIYTPVLLSGGIVKTFLPWCYKLPEYYFQY